MESQSVLDNFDNLRKPPKFHHACCKLIKHLDRSQQNKGKAEVLSQEMKYALKRLIRGMGSADQGTVVGFSACLAALLKSHSDIINISTIHEYVESELELKSSLLRGEEGIVTFGRVLVYGCIIRSDIMNQLNKEEKSFILDQLLLFCYKRSYVSGPVYYYIENFLKIVNFDKKYVKIVLSHVLNNKFHMNIDMLHLLLTLQNVNLPSLMATTQSKAFAIASSLPNIYELDTVPEFVNILTDIRSTDDLNLTVYARFANNLLHVYSKQSPRIVKELWNEVETKVLTSRELTLNKKLAVFKLFCSLILHCETSQQIVTFLTPNFLHTVVKVTSDIPSDLVHSTSPMFVLNEKFSNKLVLKRKTDKLGYETVEHGTTRVNHEEEETSDASDSDGDVSDDEVADTFRVEGKDVLTMIELFLRDPALINVEKITHTKIVQTLINSLDKENVHRLATLYKSILDENGGQQRTNGTPPSKKQRHGRGGKENGIGEHKKTSYNNKDKIYILSMLSKLVLHPSLTQDHRVTPSTQGGKANGDACGDSEEQAWKYEQVEYVFDLALGVSPWNHELAAAYKKALFSLLGHQLHHELLEQLVHHANQLVVNGQTKNMKMTPEISACWSQCQDMITKLKKKIASAAGKSSKTSIDSAAGSKKSILIAFHTMYLQLCLYLFLDNSISIDVIEELNHCYERFDEKQKKTSTVDSEEPHWIEVVTELFLSLLSKESQLLRHLVGKVFKLLVPTLTVQTVQQILQVLDPSKNPLKGDGLEESDDEDDNEDEDNAASEDEEVDNEAVEEEEEEEQEKEEGKTIKIGARTR
uniref:Myb-binding protein 1A n=2 Tax=Cacopsylla melanoneura TaxID=428564 RepID=A0A8D8V6P7_9HEMI